MCNMCMALMVIIVLILVWKFIPSYSSCESPPVKFQSIVKQ